jgi:hypothetical protein
MTILPSGALRVKDGEVITLTIDATGAQTNFGVVYSMTGEHGVIPSSAPFPITLNWDQATGDSDIPGARSNVLVLTFNFDSADGGQYDYTLAGDPSGIPPLRKRAVQAGNTATVNDFIFHILPPQA